MSISEQTTKSNTNLNSIEDAINDIRLGKVVVVVDDENRENEGDFIAAAEKVTPEMINFMALHGRGLICAPLTETRCDELGLNMMVQNNTVLHNTQFTVSVDLIGQGCTTGISTSDRSKTIKSLIENKTKPSDLGRPGHIFPLKAKNGGVLRRTGHTEAAIDFARLAGFKSAGVIVEIMNDDGSMSRLPELFKVAEKFNLKLVSIEDLVAYRMKNDSLISKSFDKEVKTNFGNYRLRAYKQTNNDQVHIALTLGKWNKDDIILTRINSSVVDNDVTKILSGTNEKKYDKIFDQINKVGKGAVIFINQNQSSENILKKLNSMNEDSEKPKIDFRDFGIGAQILHDLDISKVNLLSNSEQKHRVGLSGYGLSIVDYTNY